MRFTASITGPGPFADGMAVVWSTKSSLALGGHGEDLGICGAANEGLAFALRTLDEHTEVLGVDDTCERHVGLDGRLAGILAIGFAAATGELTARHAVDALTIEACP